jgi:hypothetical protein
MRFQFCRVQPRNSKLSPSRDFPQHSHNLSHHSPSSSGLAGNQIERKFHNLAQVVIIKLSFVT